jgi:hypothetical protein
MNGGEQGFLIVYEFDDDDRPLIIEDDGRVCYAHVRGPLGQVVSSVWLYNRVPAPEDAEPDSLAREAAPANPQRYTLDWGDRIPPQSATDFRASIFKATNTPTAFNVFIRDELFAVLRADQEVGMSKLAKRDGPLAGRPPSPGEMWWQVVEPYWDRVDIYGGGRAFLRTFAEVPEPAAHLLAVQWCQSEVCNGGFHQFFSNPTGVLAPEAAQGFRAIGMPSVADVVEKAMVMFGTPYPRKQEKRRRFLRGFSGEGRDEWDPFTALDDAFYKEIGEGDLNDALCDAADAYAARAMPVESQVNLTPDPQIAGELSYVRLGLAD